MKKIPLYEIFKIDTTRLDRENYDIRLTYEQAIANGEVVQLASSQTLRKIRETCNYKHNQNFIKEYVAIKVDKKKHYKNIIKNGLYINGSKYVRFGCSAGNARVSVVFLVKEDIYDKLNEIMMCGVKPFKIVPAKFTTYYTLNSSSTYEITEPRVVVVPDFEETLTHRFDWINSDGSIDNKNVNIEGYPPFDGQGVVSVEFAKQIAKDIELDYVPSAFIMRNTFIKGGIVTMDIHNFARKIAGHDNLIPDLWGNVYNVNDVDMILTESQFKLWQGYDSWESYVDYLHKYNLGWGVTKFTHKQDDKHAFTNYQFLQVLDLDDSQIENICQPTLDWIDDVSGGDIMKLILYMCGVDKEVDIRQMDDYALLSLIYNNDLIEDSYIKTKIFRSINKKIRQSYAGKLILDGNFSHMASDPYAFLEYVFGLPVVGLLKNEEHFNGFWNKKNKSKVIGCRSPLTHFSEVNELHLVNNEKTREWYKHIDNCVTVLNIYGNDTMVFADSDFDGD